MGCLSTALRGRILHRLCGFLYQQNNSKSIYVIIPAHRLLRIYFISLPKVQTNDISNDEDQIRNQNYGSLQCGWTSLASER